MAPEGPFFFVKVCVDTVKEHMTPDDDIVEEIETDGDADAETAIPATEKTGAWRERLQAVASEVAAREGCEIYDIEFVGHSGGRALRVYIDKAPTDTAGAPAKGVSIDDCANVSRGLNLLLDVEDLIPGGAYHLEVSSPGLERSLRTARHFTRALGTRLLVRTYDVIANLDPSLDEVGKNRFGRAKQIEGVLRAMSEMAGDEQAIGHSSGWIELEADGPSGQPLKVRLPLAKVSKTQTVFALKTNEKPSGGKKKHA